MEKVELELVIDLEGSFSEDTSILRLSVEAGNSYVTPSNS